MTNLPIDTIRINSVTATIWDNSTEERKRYAVTFARNFKNEANEWQESQSFSGLELFALAKAADSAYGRINQLLHEAK